jgi:hypothetical protein
MNEDNEEILKALSEVTGKPVTGFIGALIVGQDVMMLLSYDDVKVSNLTYAKFLLEKTVNDVLWQAIKEETSDDNTTEPSTNLPR